MNELKYNIYFIQLLIAIQENKDITESCKKIDKELNTATEEDCKIVFLSQFTNNTIKLFKFDTIQEVENYIHNLQNWLNQIPCIASFIDILQYSYMIQFIIMSKNYYPEIDLCCKDNILNSILDNLDKIKINAIILPFLNYCLKFYLQKGISLIYKNTCDKLIMNIEKLMENTSIRNQGIFRIPLLEKDLEE